jgi:hypothetical protein
MEKETFPVSFFSAPPARKMQNACFGEWFTACA